MVCQQVFMDEMAETAGCLLRLPSNKEVYQHIGRSTLCTGEALLAMEESVLRGNL